MFRDSKKEGALEYADWRAKVEEYIKKGYEDNKIKDAMLFSLEGKDAGISGIVMNMVTCHLLRSLNGWTCPIMPPWTSWTSMPGCAA